VQFHFGLVQLLIFKVQTEIQIILSDFKASLVVCTFGDCCNYLFVHQVCEVYKLHKETYYLAVDFVDRFLATAEDVITERLQLLGVTALFIAAKIEVFY
jgi:hypothetical protein